MCENRHENCDIAEVKARSSGRRVADMPGEGLLQMERSACSLVPAP